MSEELSGNRSAAQDAVHVSQHESPGCYRHGELEGSPAERRVGRDAERIAGSRAGQSAGPLCGAGSTRSSVPLSDAATLTEAHIAPQYGCRSATMR